MNERGSAIRHAIEPRQDPYKVAKHKFVLEVANQINEHAQAGDLEQLVLISPGLALHDLREAFSVKVTGSLLKDLTRTPDHDIPSHLAAWWRKPAEA